MKYRENNGEDWLEIQRDFRVLTMEEKRPTAKNRRWRSRDSVVKGE